MSIRRLLAAQLVLSAGGPALGDELRYSWAPVPEAAYYQGEITREGDVTFFRTQETWLLLEQGSVLSMTAVDKQGRSLKPVTSQSEPLPEPPPPAPVSEGLLPPPLPPPVVEGNGEPDGPMPDPSARAAVQFELGREWTVSRGGVSNYAGAASIGGTAVRGEWAPERWYLELQVEAHNYTTKVNEHSGGAASTRTANFLRLDTRAGGFYDYGVAWGHAYRLAFGGGLEYFKLPVLAIVNDATGVAELEERSAIGPFFGCTYERYLPSRHDFGVEVSYMPFAFAGSAAAFDTYGYWRFRFTPAFYSEVGAAAARDAVSTQADCEVSNCRDQIDTVASRFQLRFGLGWYGK